MTLEGASGGSESTRETRIMGCTVVARNYLSYADVVSAGWFRFHPSFPFYVFIIDDDEPRPAAGGDARFLAPADLGIPAAELERLRGIYSIGELTCALKPHLLRFLLSEGADAVIYIDSDTDIHGPLTDVAALAQERGVALSPNILDPPPLDGHSPSELDLGPVGIFNSGFLAVGPRGGDFLQWWASRLRWDCLFAELGGMHADQRWLDRVPLYFDHAVIRDPAFNVAHWNVHERRLAWQGDNFTVNGQPLGSFHFAGFDPRTPTRLTAYPLRSPFRADLGEPVIASICRRYSEKLMAADFLATRETPYPYARSVCGRPLGWWERRVYREALLAAEARGDEPVPGPFDAERSEEFERLVEDPRSFGGLSELALTRLADGRAVLEGGRWSRRRVEDAVRARVARGVRTPRPRWMPNPLTADQTRVEYVPAIARTRDGVASSW